MSVAPPCAVAFALCCYDCLLHGFVLYLLVYLPIRVVYCVVLDAFVLGPRNNEAAMMNTNTSEQQSNTHTHTLNCETRHDNDSKTACTPRSIHTCNNKRVSTKHIWGSGDKTKRAHMQGRRIFQKHMVKVLLFEHPSKSQNY